jgi:photosystem II stability/assembly factor-like uncharacterized protein
MKISLYAPFLTACLFILQNRTAVAQWSEIPHPSGAYIYDDMVVVNGKVYTSFYFNNQLKCVRTEDYLHWELVADLPASHEFGGARIIAHGTRLFVFGANKYQHSANAYQSDDNGLNWTAIGLPTIAPHLFLPLSNEALLCASDGVVSRSTDGGANWQTVQSATGAIFDIKRIDDQAILLTTATKLYRSTDEGSTWESFQAPYDAFGNNFPELGIYPTQLGVFVELKKDTISTLFRSQDGGTTWATLTLPTFYDHSNLWDLTSVGSTLWAEFDGGIATSVDAGETWEFQLTPPSSYQIAAKGDTIFAGGSSGFFKTYNHAQTWLSGNLGWQESGLPLTSYLFGNQLLAAKDKLYLSTYDGLFCTENDGIEWELKSNYGPFTNLFQNGDSVAFLGRGALRSLDGGENWDFLGVDTFQHPLGGQYNFSQVNDHLFASAWFDNVLYESLDAGFTWQPLVSGLQFIDLLASDGTALYASDWDGVHRSTDYAQTFSPFNNGLGSNPYIDGLWGVEGNVFALSNDQLYSKNGNQWKPATIGLYDDMGNLPFIGSVVGTQTASLLFGTAMTEPTTYLYISYDQGQTWEGNLAEGLPSVYDLKGILFGDAIYAFGDSDEDFESHIWKRSIPLPSGVSQSYQGEELRPIPNPAKDETNLVFPNNHFFTGVVNIVNVNGDIVHSMRYNHVLHLSIPLADFSNGLYFVSLVADNGNAYHSKLMVLH